MKRHPSIRFALLTAFLSLSIFAILTSGCHKQTKEQRVGDFLAPHIPGIATRMSHVSTGSKAMYRTWIGGQPIWVEFQVIGQDSGQGNPEAVVEKDAASESEFRKRTAAALHAMFITDFSRAQPAGSFGGYVTDVHIFSPSDGRTRAFQRFLIFEAKGKIYMLEMDLLGYPVSLVVQNKAELVWAQITNALISEGASKNP